METELISLVVPAYNMAPWLPRTLESLLSQTYENLEIIVVNDGSKDDTKAVLDAFATRERKIRVIHKENGGVTSARLAGVSAAAGDWIGFVDGDDTVEPQMFAKLLENAKACNADISHCGHRVLFPDGRVELVHGTGDKRLQDRLTGIRELLDGAQIESSLCTKLFRRELFEKLEEKMDPAIKNGEDYLMNYYLFAAAKCAVYEDVCPYYYILRHGSASYRAFNAHSLFDPIRARQKILAECEPAIQKDARIALMRNILFAYGQLALNLDKQYDGYREKARKWLKEQREFFPLLSTRNRILAGMICTAPWTFHLAYGLYVKLFQKEEQH